ncbi:uncharacterized protein LOC119463481 [Dermacentor silvarum]|uniref:uncharacterized protein LOC119463481 n=1 Tax=Dermacentor silvarum TaxID=543639 RepID=UPI00189B8F88|nr:uncharacterized protein LOC119463481 [Dermacentor silvarum]
MEDKTLPPYVDYVNDASVTSVHGELAPLKTPPKKARKSRSTAMGLLKVAVAVLLITTVASLTLLFLKQGQPTPNVECIKIADAPAEGAAPSRVRRATIPQGRESPNSLPGARLGTLDLGTTSGIESRKGGPDLPDVTKLTLLAAGNNYITVAWERPKASFDYYWVSVTDDRGEKHPNSGSCPDGTIIRQDQTQVTCTGLESCSNVTISIRTHRNGPPERTSIGVALPHIFVPGKDCQQNLCYEWVPWSGNTVPENAVAGGQDKAGTLYVCRAKHEGLFIPGKFASWESTCYVPYNRGEQSYKDFEVLVAGNPS